MPICGNKLCQTEVDKLHDGLCGLCDATKHRRAPGHVGRDYRGQVDPDNFDAGKEMEMGMKAEEEAGRLKGKLADRFKRGMLAQVKAESAALKKHSDVVQRMRSEADQAIRDGEANMRKETEQAKGKFIETVELAKNVGALPG